MAVLATAAEGGLDPASKNHRAEAEAATDNDFLRDQGPGLGVRSPVGGMGG
jgi:hypothetical protein